MDTPLYASAVMCDKRYIVAKHKSSNTERRFNNLTEFKGRGNDSKTFGAVGSWLYELNQEQIKNNKEQFGVKEFVITTKVEQREEIVAAKSSVNNFIDKLLLLPWVNIKKLKFVIGGCDTDDDYSPNFRFEVAKSFLFK